MDNQGKITIAIILVICYLIYRQTKKSNSNKSDNYQNNWINRDYGYGYGEMTPAKKLFSLIKELGDPCEFNRAAGGNAIWKTKNLKGKVPYEMVEIRDEQILHDKPQKHTDFLYTWYKIEIPKTKVKQLHNLGDNISYDPLTKLVQVRCQDLRSNTVFHWIINKFVDDQLNIDEANGMYGPMIMELLEDKSNSKYHQLLSEL